MTFGCMTSLTRGERSLISSGGSTPNLSRTKSMRSLVFPARAATTLGVPGEALQFRVGDRGTDGIHVGILVANDDRLHRRGRCGD